MMKPAAVETLVWVLIYVGLLLVVLGLAVQRLEVALGWSLVGVGAVMAAVGVALIWVRSRMGR
jgi:hypothetical protein